MQFRALGTVTLGGADCKARHAHTHVLDLRAEVPVAEIRPARATRARRERKRRQCRGRRDGAPGRDQRPPAARGEPGRDDPPRVRGAQGEVHDVCPHEPALAEAQRAREARRGREEQQGERDEHARGAREVVRGHERVRARLEHAVERHCGQVVRVRAEDRGGGRGAVF